MSNKYVAVALRGVADTRAFSIPKLLKLLAAAIAVTLASSVANALPQFVQESSLWDSNSHSTMSVTLTDAQIAGDFLFVAVGWGNSTATINSISDSRGNSYTLAAGPVTISGTASQSVYYAKKIASAPGGANMVTVVFSATVPSPSLRVVHFNGIDTTNPVDVISNQTGTSTGGDITFDYVTATSSGILLAAGYTGGPITPGDGMLALSNNGQGFIESCGIGIGAGGTCAVAVQNGAGPWWIVQSVVFKTAAPGSIPSTAGSATYQYDSFGRLKQVTVTPQ